MRYIASVNNKDYVIEIVDETHVLVDGELRQVDFMPVGGGLIYSLLVEGNSFEVHVYPEEDFWQVIVHGEQYSARVEDERERRLRAAAGAQAVDHGEYLLKAPMPGMVVAIPVKDGDMVEKGQVLLVLESMKMQNELKSPRAGKVGRIRVEQGESVEQKQVLLTVN
ncbi:MAG: acetyl-CoA carboxylase biotin carboxyl carrier protein subunit [Chloroflexi bacterium]|nr:MAG: acetyl-CoA carboxylase biotin carboxyl carrier protein subunit [Chloroflexota bacterium]